MKTFLICSGVAFLLLVTACSTGSSTPSAPLSLSDFIQFQEQASEDDSLPLQALILFALFLGLVSMVYIFLLAFNFLYYLELKKAG